MPEFTRPTSSRRVSSHSVMRCELRLSSTQNAWGWRRRKAVVTCCTKLPDRAGITPTAMRPWSCRRIASTAFSTCCTPLKMRSISS